ncbi:DUF4422 domain-containing protein [Convivina intestini]|uniref:Uncharacterized protein DUF4422 n=1 Tax=Convivina intestini TaxID=1505726 RepID=A0A2U1DCJ4_9LACO|nr:DUF4422 domain-containing protein [Convivina intestini]PVY85292.1 uncharacterized protein DUF4422 [Convivina intestini]CAH1852772.1 hypothetical protein R077811_00510 [Convivina intestini]SDB86652.1 protein of unknown function [Leuconostocaceae bacterium R-53105]
MAKAKIYVASHKEYAMPQNSLYQPIFVGSSLKDGVPAGYQPDNTGDNISGKNPNYNELTALYWIWKNDQNSTVIGLNHYRRYLGAKASHQLADRLTTEQIENLLNQADIILPKARNYYIENQGDHYLHAHAHAPYEIMKRVLAEKFSAYYPAFQALEKSTSAHLFNMFIMPRAYFEEYAAFVFAVLAEVEQQVDIDQLEGQEKRVFGFLSELLMDTWVNTKGLKVVECPVINLEKTNWLDKGYHFLKRKFLPNTKKKVHF